MAKGINQRDLLYVANINGTVSVYTYWQRNIIGVLLSFKRPHAVCADRESDIYITDSKTKKIYEYAHGGKKALRVVDNSPYVADACAVNLANDDLAVANYGPVYYKAGNITVYPHGSGKPVVYGAGNFDHFLACGYDGRGDLLAVSKYGYSSPYYDDYYYLPKGSHKLLPITLPGSHQAYTGYNGDVQTISWDGKYWVVDVGGDLLRYAINIKAKYIDTITLTPSSGSVGAIALYRKGRDARATQVVGATGGYSIKNAAEYWKYPTGGTPFAEITKDLDNPFGIAISLRTQ